MPQMMTFDRRKVADLTIGLAEVLLILRREGYLNTEALGFELPNDLRIVGARVAVDFNGAGELHIGLESDGLPDQFLPADNDCRVRPICPRKAAVCG